MAPYRRSASPSAGPPRSKRKVTSPVRTLGDDERGEIGGELDTVARTQPPRALDEGEPVLVAQPTVQG